LSGLTVVSGGLTLLPIEGFQSRLATHLILSHCSVLLRGWCSPLSKLYIDHRHVIYQSWTQNPLFSIICHHLSPHLDIYIRLDPLPIRLFTRTPSSTCQSLHMPTTATFLAYINTYYSMSPPLQLPTTLIPTLVSLTPSTIIPF
jgi:hypothetical protein